MSEEEALEKMSPQFKQKGLTHKFVYYDSGYIFSICHFDAKGHIVGGDVINYTNPAKDPKYIQLTLF